jgi:acetoin utilization protein AcuB
MLVKDWMTTYVHTVAPGDPINDAVLMMKEKNVRHLPVVENGVVAGVLSDRDIKEFAPSKGTSLDVYELNYLLAKTTVSQVMKKPPVTIAPDVPVEEAAMMLFDKRIGCLPVVEGGRLVGIISDRDMYRVLVEITGARQGGIRVSLPLEDRPGSIKEATDIARKHGFRIQSIMSTQEKASPSQRYVVIRTHGEGDYEALRKELLEQFRAVRIRKS